MATSPRARISPEAREIEFHRTDQRYRTARSLGRYSVIAFGLWQGRLALEALAGQKTELYLEALLGAFAAVHVAVWIGLAGATTVWALAERKLRHRVIVRLHTRIREIEMERDPNRSSSGLTTKGQTNPTDRGA